MHAIIIVQLPYKAKCVKNIKKKHKNYMLHEAYIIVIFMLYIFMVHFKKNKSFHIYKNKRQVKIYKVSLVSCK